MKIFGTFLQKNMFFSIYRKGGFIRPFCDIKHQV